MRQQKKVLLTLVFTALLASCGGGGGDAPPSTPFKFSQMITFGDSLSDVGTYKVGAIAASKGGQFTINSPTAKNWTEVLAAKYGLPAPCAAQTGFNSLIPGFDGEATKNIATCRNYAQGSARVTNVFGPNSKAIQDVAPSAAPLGFTALPVFNQINNHLAAAGGVFSPTELVVVLAGGNDVFLNLGAVGSLGTTGFVGAANFAGWSAAQLAAVNDATTPAAAGLAAQTAALQGMTKAGTELATYIKTLIVAKGAKFVAVVNLPDVGQTPLAASLGTPTAALLTALSTTFNSAVADGLAGVPEVTIVDALTQGRAQVANPGAFGILGGNKPACATGAVGTSGNPLGNDAGPSTPAGGPSITCTPLSTIKNADGSAIDVSKYQFADNVHLSPYGNVLFADFVYGRLSAAGFPK